MALDDAHPAAGLAAAMDLQEDRCDLDPLTASVYTLANTVYPNDAQLAATAVASALTGFGVALYRGVIMELKVTPADHLCAGLTAGGERHAGNTSPGKIVCKKPSVTESQPLYLLLQRMAACPAQCWFALHWYT